MCRNEEEPPSECVARRRGGQQSYNHRVVIFYVSKRKKKRNEMETGRGVFPFHFKYILFSSSSSFYSAVASKVTYTAGPLPNLVIQR